MESDLEQKKNRLFIALSGIFLTNALIAEMIGVKIFSGEATLGLAPALAGRLKRAKILPWTETSALARTAEART